MVYIYNSVHGTGRTVHHGGVITIENDSNVYVALGEAGDPETKSRNVKNGSDPVGTSGILRFDPDGEPAEGGILGNADLLNLYYAYGIRNSFGMDFDPVTGNLWDTENGPFYGDEINLVEPGFNSGWQYVQGKWKHEGSNRGGIVHAPITELVDYDGSGKYRAPEFIWNNTVGPTALKFLNSEKLGKECENDMFVGDINNGFLYHFNLNKNRTGLSLDGVLQDKMANNRGELEGVIFGQGFGGGITDLDVGPDGLSYILSVIQDRKACENMAYLQTKCGLGTGIIHRIKPVEGDSREN